MPALMNFSPKNFKLSESLCRTDTYPFASLKLSLTDLPPRLLYEDDICADYLLYHSRIEHSSDVLEFLLSYREFEREREINILAQDEKLVRTLLVTLLTRHIEDGAKQPVSLSGSVEAALRKWLEDFKAAEPIQAKLALALPLDALADACEQCMRDLQNDILPRFRNSAMGAELARVHPGACLANVAVQAAIRKQGPSDALDFWVEAHTFATSSTDVLKAKEVHQTFGPKLPLFGVPIAECQRIEELLAAATSAGVAPPADVFLAAQTFAVNDLYRELYPAFLASSEGKKMLGVITFDKKKMPPPPESSGTYEAEW